MKVCAIDPGNTQSAYCVMESEDFKPIKFEKIDNSILADLMSSRVFTEIDDFAIERVACYGMPVGKEVFFTCEWIGRFTQIILDTYGKQPNYVMRLDEKLTICNKAKAGDANIRRALIDRFAEHDFKNGKGTKGNPDWFYGFSRDVWAAYAVGYTFVMMKGNGGF